MLSTSDEVSPKHTSTSIMALVLSYYYWKNPKLVDSKISFATFPDGSYWQLIVFL